MTTRVVALAVAALLLVAPATSFGAPKAPRKKANEATASKKVEKPVPRDEPDNVVLPVDNGARAEAPAAPAPSPALPPPPAPLPAIGGAPGDAASMGNDAAAAMGNDAEYNRRLLAQAVRMGLLKPGAPPSALTHEVMNRMIDVHVLKDAIRHGLLPANAPPSRVTPELRAVMKKGGYLVHYYPDGSVNPNYGKK